MIKRKSTLKYYFSVEGETELWYLEWLQDQINNTLEASSKVSFNKQIQKDPLKRAKSLAITSKVEIWHLSDYESSEEIHVKQFRETMDLFHTESNTLYQSIRHMTKVLKIWMSSSMKRILKDV